MTISPSVVEQAEQTFLNIQAALTQAGATIQDIVRVRYILPERRDFELVWSTLRRWLGECKPAATMLVAGLHEERMLIEVEVTAYVQQLEEKEDARTSEPPA
jgi:enamine deaminase RidA (YjgF/YER057c/UK114 family)